MDRSGFEVVVCHRCRWRVGVHVARRRLAERSPRVRPFQFRATAAFGSALTGGATTPIEMMYFSASSTLMRSAITSARGTIRKKPEVGFGVVGTYRLR